MPLPPRFNKAFAQVPVGVRRAAAVWRSPRSGKATAREGVGKPCRKVQPLIFKRGMLRFDSLLGARSFHALVPHTPMGFSLPAEAFSGQLLSCSRCGYRCLRCQRGSGLPSKSAPAAEGAGRGSGSVMGSPSSPSETLSVAPQGLPSPGGPNPHPFHEKDASFIG